MNFQRTLNLKMEKEKWNYQQRVVRKYEMSVLVLGGKGVRFSSWTLNSMLLCVSMDEVAVQVFDVGDASCRNKNPS